MKFDQIEAGMIFETYARDGAPSERRTIIDIDRAGGRIYYDNGRRRVWCSASIWNGRSSTQRLVVGSSGVTTPSDDGVKRILRSEAYQTPMPTYAMAQEDSTSLLREIKDLLAEMLVEMRSRS
jgi:hypothetical protein